MPGSAFELMPKAERRRSMPTAAMSVQRLLTRNLREVTEADALAIYEAAL